VNTAGAPAVVVVGSGPIRIGQGIEFDYCSVHASAAVQMAGFASVLINSNPETVSTDFDASTRLYFEPLDEEGVLAVLRREQPAGALVQFGGQTAINLAEAIAASGTPILGSSVEAIDLAEDRRRCEMVLRELGIPQPRGGSAASARAAVKLADRVGYPVVVRPSYVLGGRAVEIVHSRAGLCRYLARSTSARRTIHIDRYVSGREVEVDAICDGKTVLIPGILEHVERAGVHSGDSIAIYPPASLTESEVNQVVAHTLAMARAFGVVGLLNIQFAVRDGVVYVLELNPRASRTTPFLSKVTGVPMVQLATAAVLGQSLVGAGYDTGLIANGHVRAVKAPIFSMAKLPGIDPLVGPEMKSTGEVMGIAPDPAAARYKAFLASIGEIPAGAAALCSIDEADRAEALPILLSFHRLGIRLLAPTRTFEWLAKAGVPVRCVGDVREGCPDVLGLIQSGEVQLLLDTVSTDRSQGGPGSPRHDYELRRASVERGVPCLTSLDTARALADALADSRARRRTPIATLGEYVNVDAGASVAGSAAATQEI
jgi:carbamoyl-phosphate synthase large subunit